MNIHEEIIQGQGGSRSRGDPIKDKTFISMMKVGVSSSMNSTDRTFD